MEYIIQIEPEALDGMLDGQEIESAIPNYVRDIRGYRIRIGRDELPRIGGNSPEIGQPTPAKPKPSTSGDTPTPANPRTGEPTLAKPDLSGPALNAPTVRGQNSDEDDRSTRFADRYGEPPRRLENTPTPAKKIDDFAADDFSTKKSDPFSGSRVTPTDYREDEPAPTRGTVSRPSSSSKSTTTSRPSRANLDDEPEERPTSATKSTKPTSTRTSSATSRPSSKSSEETATAEKPWFAFTMVVLALFASLGGNWYLGWMNWDLRNKYQRALNDRKWRRDDYEPSARVA